MGERFILMKYVKLWKIWSTIDGDKENKSINSPLGLYCWEQNDDEVYKLYGWGLFCSRCKQRATVRFSPTKVRSWQSVIELCTGMRTGTAKEIKQEWVN